MAGKIITQELQLIRFLLESLPGTFWGFFGQKRYQHKECENPGCYINFQRQVFLHFFQAHPHHLCNVAAPWLQPAAQAGSPPAFGARVYKPVLPSCRHSELINGTFQCPELWRAASPEFSCRLMISHKMRSTKLLLPLAVQIRRWRTTRERMGTCLLLLLS